MYAVIESGGKQHRVEPGEVLQLEKLDVAEGDKVDFDKVMLIGDGDSKYKRCITCRAGKGRIRNIVSRQSDTWAAGLGPRISDGIAIGI